LKTLDGTPRHLELVVHLAPKNTAIDSVVSGLEVEEDIDHVRAVLHNLVQTKDLVKGGSTRPETTLIVRELIHDRVEGLQYEALI
jgi:hypothetical protein